MSDETYNHQLSCLGEVYTFFTTSAVAKNPKDFSNLEEHLSERNVDSNILDASEAFVAATEIEKKFIGPAILLYVSSVNAFAPGPDVELREQIRGAKKIFKELNIINNPDVKATYNAAYDKANFVRLTKFLESEFSETLKQSSLNYKDNIRKKIVKGMVAASHKTRHEGKIDPRRRSTIVVAGGSIHDLDEKDMKKLKAEGRLSFDGCINGIFQTEFSSKPLLRPAKFGSAYCIMKHFKDWVEKIEKR
ncbi:MAG: hypothetical protein ABIK26_01190 [Candidatus Omnitrophota bacterium]